MQFDQTDTQSMLSDSLRRLLESRVGQDGRHSSPEIQAQSVRATWSSLAELGVAGLMLSEDSGGFGGTAADLMVVMEEIGRVAAITPMLHTAVLAAGAIELLGDDVQKDSWLSNIVDGKSIFACPSDISTPFLNPIREQRLIASSEGGGWKVSGAVPYVLDAAAADFFLLPAAIDDDPVSPTIGLFIVPRAVDGLAFECQNTYSGRASATLRLDGVLLRAESHLGIDSAQKRRAIADLERMGMLGACAEAMGSMSTLLKETSAYLATRKQFGRALSEFQSLQHRIVDMAMTLEECRSAVMYGIASQSNEDVSVQASAAAAAKLLTDRASRFISQQAVQLHGGIGMTVEAPISPYVLDLTMFPSRFTSVEQSLNTLVSTGGVYKNGYLDL